MTIGDAPSGTDSAGEPAGLMVCSLGELYSREMRPDRLSASEKSTVNVRDEYSSYWVTLNQETA
jgi:hypothetical protein